MSNLSEALNAIGVSDGTAVKAIGAGLGLLADLSGGVSAITGVIGLFVGGGDQTAAQLGAIQQSIAAGFAQLGAEQRAQHILDRLNSLDPAIAQAQTDLDQLPDVLAQQPPVSEEVRLRMIGECLFAANQLDRDDKWQTNSLDEIYYNDPWTGTQAPPTNADGLAFSKRYVLPQFLQTYYVLGVAGTALEANFQQNYAGPLQRFVSRMLWAYNTSVQGIVSIREPQVEELYHVSGDGYSNALGGLTFSAWAMNQGLFDYEFFQLYGAVDVYSGFSSVHNFPPLPLPVPDTNPPPLPDYLANVYTRIRLSTQKQWKAVYVGIGLADLRVVVNKLQNQLVIPAIGAFDENLYWSMRSITDTLVRSGFPSPQTASGLSLFNTVQDLQQAGQVDPSGDFFVSWRQALDACAA